MTPETVELLIDVIPPKPTIKDRNYTESYAQYNRAVNIAQFALLQFAYDIISGEIHCEQANEDFVRLRNKLWYLESD